MGKNDLNIVLKYIKSYKARSIAIILSIALGTALIVGVGTLSRSAQQANLDRIKKETGTEHVYFNNVNKEQLETIKIGNGIKDISLSKIYASTDVGEKLPINIYNATENYLTKDTKLLKGRFPREDNEIVAEEWILNSLGLELNLDQEITFKLYQKEKTETFKVVGILKDRYKDKSIGRCEVFLKFDESNLDNFTTHIEFEENDKLRNNINKLIKDTGKAKDDVGINSMLIGSIESNGRLGSESISTAIGISLFAGLVIYSIYTISVYQRIREYGVLRALGCTNLKVFKLMLQELIILSAVATPIGIMFGIGGAEIFNKLAGNIQFEGKVHTTKFVMPIDMIILSIVTTLLVIFIISMLTYMKIRKISPIESIKRNFGSDKKIKKSNILISKLSKSMFITKSISMKNIFRNKTGFIMIMLSMSIGGIMIIRTNYAYSRSEKIFEQINKGSYQNGDFILKTNTSNDKESGFTSNEIGEIKNIEGIKEVKAASILHTRMIINKNDILDMNYFEQAKKSEYYGKVLEGLLIEDKDSSKYQLKQKLKGFNDEMLKSLDDYLVSGKIDIEKMKKENLAILYVENPVVDINVGDTVKVKYPKGKINVADYWRGKDDYDYYEYEFKIGAIVNYPFADDNMYASNTDVIVSDKYLETLVGPNRYNVVYANMEDGADHKVINKQLGKIGSKVPGTITTDMVKEQEDNIKSRQKSKIYNYGIIAVMFTISIFNIINNASYNITSRTTEFGMLRAVGISEKDFKNMIIYEGLLYGIIASIIVLILGILLQIRMYKTFGFASYGMEFELAYKEYIIIVATNIIIGLIATYLPAKKIKNSSIVEVINITE